MVAAACGALAASLSGFADDGSPRVFRAYDFTDSVGVNTHLIHADSFYGTQFELMKDRLLSAGIRHIRDGAMDQRGGFFQGDLADRYRELGRAGIRVTFIFRLSASKEFLQDFPARVAPAFEAYELPNELNVQNKAWVETLRAWMPAFRQYVKSNPATASYPIIGPSMADLGNDPYGQLGSEEANLDFGNLHKYYRSYGPATSGYGGIGKPPCEGARYGSLAYALCHAAKISGGKPVICTESGYGSNGAPKHVTPEVQAKYIARMLMLHLKAGIRRTFIYQLADYGTDGFGDFGLLTANGDEKPAFRELGALMREMGDMPHPGPPEALPVSMTGDTADVQSLLLRKSDGSYRLVLWIEKPSYDPKANVGAGDPLDVPAQNVTLSLPPPYRVRRVLTFTASGVAQTEDASASSNPFGLGARDNLTVVDIARWPFPEPVPRPPTLIPDG